MSKYVERTMCPRMIPEEKNELFHGFSNKGSFTQCDLFVCDGDFLKYFLCDLRASVHTVHFCVNAFAKLEKKSLFCSG